MNNEVRIEIKDLDQAVGTELSSEELQAVTGGVRMEVTWTCGSQGKADEWDIKN
ncbi:bacteriocin [Peristeroidobacter soli]|jgi:bacteriocin-like protein|uniref:bacteriocin n=1 Tax=Peristeroidobacter soli TaxID=2497877 RepID=UPI00101DBA6C|nr:bacteriocin [Peristeroidobacter soli]